MGLASLLDDRGAASESDDLFRCRAFLDAEGVTHTLRIEADAASAHVPVIVRSIPGSDRVDAISPYGYPGGLVRGPGPMPTAAEVDWRATGLVSVFARERLTGPTWIDGARERSSVLVHDPARPRAVRRRMAEQVRANERDGWAVEVVEGPRSTRVERDAFAAAYEQTMTRAGASQRYFFAAEHFDAVLSFERSWLLAARREGVIGAAALAGVSDGILHYYLGATADAAREASPFKNVVVAMLDLADELALMLNLGGGVQPGDGLERFKRGFANSRLPFRTHEAVCDRDAYESLAGGRDAGGFFPAYRAP